jgi:hypothetical protein
LPNGAHPEDLTDTVTERIQTVIMPKHLSGVVNDGPHAIPNLTASNVIPPPSRRHSSDAV